MNCKKKPNNSIDISRKSLNSLSKVAYKYGQKGRKKFPWRQNINPYRVFVSEFFLQRTGAIQASKIFNTFINLYPSISSISKIKKRELLGLLQPLGLRHRTVAFLKATRQVINDFKGKIPYRENDLLKIFGIGKYLSRAILCFGYNKKVGIIDPNIARVFERYFCFKAVKKRPQTSSFLWELADRLCLNNNRSARITNWGLLDLGREICRKRNPSCNKCPLRLRCRSRIIIHEANSLGKK